MNQERPKFVFDGFGINGPDEYRTRVATFNPEFSEKYGHHFERALAAFDDDKALRLLRAAVSNLVYMFRESHEENMRLEQDTSDTEKGMRMHRDDEPNCSYCAAIKQGNEAYEYAKGIK